MATALALGMLRAGVASPGRITASDPSADARRSIASDSAIRATESNREVVSCSDVLVLAVKPQSMEQVLQELLPWPSAGPLVISVAAGVRIETITATLGSSARVVRVMPNTPALLGEGAAGYCLGAGVSEADERVVRRCLESVGKAIRVPESLMDAVTGLGGSGPAFVYVIIEALSDGGVRMGLPREVATLMAAQTVAGAARMVLETGKHPGSLKDEVTSPGGTTIAGLHALERGGLRAAIMDAVEAATKRSEELSAVSKRS